MTTDEQDIVTAFDVGATHVTVMVARRSTAGEGNTILGATSVPCVGMRKGAMVNLEAVTNAIHDALDEVERQTGLEIDEVRVAAASLSAQCDNRSEELPLRSGEVKVSDVEKLATIVRAHRPQPGNDFVHLIPGEFHVDEKAGVVNPVGMFGSKLGSLHHRVQMPAAELKNLLRAFNNAGLKVARFGYEPLTAAEGVLTHDEKELGVASVNLGASLTHLAVYAGRVPLHCRDLPVASHHVTKDLAIGLRTTLVEAERLKREFGLAFIDGAGAFEPVEIQSIESGAAGTSRYVTRQEIARIVEARAREILTTLAAEIRRQNLGGSLGKGVVLSGGGALLAGLVPLAEGILKLPCRLGLPLQPIGITESLRTPSAATAFGLLAPVFASVQTQPDFLARESDRPGGFIKLSKSLFSRLKEPFG
jgi:cell division protein FtsA